MIAQAFIDFQMLSKAPPGLELTQLLIGAFSDLADYENSLDDVLAHYYAELVRESGAAMPSYSYDDYCDDFMTGCVLTYARSSALGSDGDMAP